ncbi:aspartyl-phosphate phosphatase Spo0E family protein [Lentibacillus juripiscarius]|uniref:Aspartyl-phosphate phosphatase Spo0E family protein n=1 Tax=Lentibacillus juripiscarius TaxID=257446 RepID=A0ABW5V375_9BACI
MDKNSILLKKIEQCRKEMLNMSSQYGLTSQAVIQSSQRLDELLNQYQNA